MTQTRNASDRITRAVATAVATATVLVSLPSWTSAQADPTAAIKQTIEKRYPGTSVVKVQPSPIPGVFEVYTGGEIVYSDARGDYLIAGPIVDTATRRNLTEARLSDFGRVDFKALPFDRAIKVVKGNGSRQFAVFSDPDCPFCQQLERTLLSVNNVTMYVFLYPIVSLHPQAEVKSHAIWCASNRSEAWSQWMHEKKLPPSKTCSGDPVDQLRKLGDSLRINGTPTMFFSDGRRVSGAIPLEDLEKNLGTTGGSTSGTAIAPQKQPAAPPSKAAAAAPPK